MGRKLIDELGTEPRAQTLSCWMAHYIAELIDAAEGASPNEQAARKEKCYDAILQLWNHRAALPNGMDPLEDFKPIARALKRLDPDGKGPSLIQFAIGDNPDPDEDPSIVRLLKFARYVEMTTRILMYYTFVEAARLATGRSMEWLKLATDADLSVPSVECMVQYRAVEGGGDNRETARLKRERENVEKHKKILDEFVTMASDFGAQLSVQLQGLRPAASSS